MQILIYFLIVFSATLVGAIAGLGGGVIIKPMLDMLGDYNISTINLLSSFTVFSMSIVSIIKQIKNGNKILPKIAICLSIGSVIGGILGSNIFDTFAHAIQNDHLCTAIQSVMLILLLVLTLLYSRNNKKVKKYNVQNLIIIFIVGLILGCISSFLGIGGGPFNVAVMQIFFSMGIKQSVTYSIITIFFSQLYKVVDVLIFKDITMYNIEILPIMILAAIIGGYLGSMISKKLNNKKVEIVYQATTILVIFISILNIF